MGPLVYILHMSSMADHARKEPAGAVPRGGKIRYELISSSLVKKVLRGRAETVCTRSCKLCPKSAGAPVTAFM